MSARLCMTIPVPRNYRPVLQGHCTGHLWSLLLAIMNVKMIRFMGIIYLNDVLNGSSDAAKKIRFKCGFR